MHREYTADMVSKAEPVTRKINELRLDPDNVRFSHMPQQECETRGMEDIIRDDPDILDLYDQILSAKGIVEPLVIDSNNVVVEGNRRLTCLLILDRETQKGEHEEDGVEKNRFEEVQCRLLPDMKDDEKDIYLATIHVKGKKPWKRFNKAKHIYRLNQSHKMSYDEIARILGMGKVTVQRNISVYVELKKYHARFPDDKEWFKKFMIYEQFFMRRDLKEFRDVRDNMDLFAKWTYSGKFKNHKDVRRLHDILKDPDLRKVFEETNMENAVREMETRNPGLVDHDFKKINDTIDVLKNLSRAKLDEIITNPEKMKLMNVLETETKNIMIDLENKREMLKNSKR